MGSKKNCIFHEGEIHWKLLDATLSSRNKLNYKLLEQGWLFWEGFTVDLLCFSLGISHWLLVESRLAAKCNFGLTQYSSSYVLVISKTHTISHSPQNATSKIIFLACHSKSPYHPALSCLMCTLWNSIFFSAPSKISQFFLLPIFPSVHILHYVWRLNLQPLASSNRVWISQLCAVLNTQNNL